VISVQVDPARHAPSASVATPSAPETPKTIVIKDVGLETPESVLYLPDSDVYLVSNINGGPTVVDNNGFISRVGSDGSVQNLKFIAGGQASVELDAPKGMAVVGDTLFVADIAQVRRFDVTTGAAKGSLRFPKATFLNDIAADATGSLYVTDSGLKAGPSGLLPTGTDAIYKINGEKVTVFAKGTTLAGPNGIRTEGDTVLVVTNGKNLLTRFDAKGKVVATAELPAGTLDGLVVLPGSRYLVSSWASKSVYVGSFSGGFTVAASDLPSPADFDWNPKQHVLAVPGFLASDLQLVPFTLPEVPVAAAPTGVQPAADAVQKPGAAVLKPAAQPAPAASATAPSAAAAPASKTPSP